MMTFLLIIINVCSRRSSSSGSSHRSKNSSCNSLYDKFTVYCSDYRKQLFSSESTVENFYNENNFDLKDCFVPRNCINDKGFITSEEKVQLVDQYMLNQSETCSQSIIIGWSACSKQETSLCAIEAGVDAFYNKPHSLNNFTSTYEKVKEKRNNKNTKTFYDLNEL